MTIAALSANGCEDPYAADHPALNEYEGGYQLDGEGELRVWLGDECSGIASIDFMLSDRSLRTYERWRIKATSADGSTIGHFTPGMVPGGFTESDPLRRPWRHADAIEIEIRTRTTQTAAYMQVSSFLEEAEERGSDEWFVQDQGWYTQDEYRDELVGADNADVYPMCATHD